MVEPPICFPPMPFMAMALRALDSAGVTLSQLMGAAYHQSCIDYWVPQAHAPQLLVNRTQMDP